MEKYSSVWLQGEWGLGTEERHKAQEFQDGRL